MLWDVGHGVQTSLRKWLAISTLLLGVTAAAAQPSDCQLDSFRTRIDRTLQSIQVDARKEAEVIDAKGAQFHHIDYGFSGQIDGCVVLSGPIPALKPNYSYLYDSPEIALPQEHLLAASVSHPYRLPLQAGDGNQTAPQYAMGRFEAKDGAGFDLFLPKDFAQMERQAFHLAARVGQLQPSAEISDAVGLGLPYCRVVGPASTSKICSRAASRRLSAKRCHQATARC
jgi:hypothetical protein